MKKSIGYIFTITIILLFLESICYAVDPSIYFGKWKTKSGKPEITITINSRSNVTLEINKNIINNLEFEFCHCKLGGMYFLSLWSQEKYLIHYLYFSIGSTRKIRGAADYNVLRGFYELSEFIKPELEELDVQYYPLELIRVKDQEKK